MAKDDDNSGTVLAVGAIGGGALLVWWLLRERDRGVGGGGEGGGAPGAPFVTVEPLPAQAAAPCNVFLRGPSIELNGAASDRATAIATCRAAGTANLRASGDAKTGAITDMARALNAAGVAILAHGDIASTVRDALMRAA